MQKVRILMFTTIGDYPDAAMEDGMSANAFSREMDDIARHGFQVVPLQQALEMAQGAKRLPDKLLALTFDGGFRDYFNHVLPVLARHRFPATFMLPTTSMGESIKVYGVDIPCMDWDQAAMLLQDGHSIGYYAMEGKVFQPGMEQQYIQDLETAKTLFQNRLQHPLRYVSLREGVPTEALIKAAEAKGVVALMTKCPTKRGQHPFCIGRIQIDDDDPNINRIKLSSNYLFFKDSRLWRLMRRFKITNLTHLISNTFNALFRH